MQRGTRFMLRGAIDEAGLTRVAEAIERTALPSILLHPSPAGEADFALGESKLGGRPDLPEGVPWPEFGGEPLAFVAQFDLAALAPFDTGKLLPASGILLFFIADPTPYFEGGVPGEGGISRLLYFGATALPLRPSEFPSTLSLEGRYAPCKLSYSVQITLAIYDPYDPDFERQYGFPLPLSRAEVRAYNALGEKLHVEAGGTSQIMHRLLGHPETIQGSMRGDLSTEPADDAQTAEPADVRFWAVSLGPDFRPQVFRWQLLLQLDSDDMTGMRWGDTGRIYFWIRDQDLRQRNFDRMVLLDQSS